VKLLSDSEIYDICSRTVNSAAAIDYALYQYYQLLFVTGCRVSEVSAFDRWSYSAIDTVSLLPLKNNFVRNFDVAVIPTNFQLQFSGASSTMPILSSAYLGRWFFALNPVHIFKDNKQVTSYIFRYNYIKQLRLSGYTDIDIMRLIGHTRLATTQGYLNAQLYTRS